MASCLGNQTTIIRFYRRLHDWLRSRMSTDTIGEVIMIGLGKRLDKVQMDLDSEGIDVCA